MFTRYYPSEYVEDVFTIDYAKLYRQGFRALIFDIDNTLVPHGGDSTEKVDRLFERLHSMGFKTLLLSNNSEERILRFIRNIDTAYIYDAEKPNHVGFQSSVVQLGVGYNEAVVIGDQVFTDILGANRAGLSSILVKYIGYYKKEKKGIKRNLEKIILYLYRHSRYQFRLGNLQLNINPYGKEETLL